jgi:hypothetical protein
VPLPKTTTYWREQIARLDAEGWSGTKIHAAISAEAEERGDKDCPSDRQVRRILLELKALPEEERRQNGLFSWPRSMELGGLPWEASSSALRLLRWRDERGLGRPTVRHAKWYWRLLLAAPGLDEGDAHHYAATLATVEFASTIGQPVQAEQEIDWFLAYQPWASAEAKERWEATMFRPVDPHRPPALSIEPGSRTDDYLSEALFGADRARARRRPSRGPDGGTDEQPSGGNDGEAR